MDAKLREHCTNFKEISQQLFGHAIQAVDRALKPLLMQILTFQAFNFSKVQSLTPKASEGTSANSCACVCQAVRNFQAPCLLSHSFCSACLRLTVGSGTGAQEQAL